MVFTQAKRPVHYTASVCFSMCLVSTVSFISPQSFRARLKSSLFHDGVSSPTLTGKMSNLQKSGKSRTRALWPWRLALVNIFAICCLSVQRPFFFSWKLWTSRHFTFSMCHLRNKVIVLHNHNIIISSKNVNTDLTILFTIKLVYCFFLGKQIIYHCRN